MSSNTTQFTRRTGGYVFPKPTPTNGYLSIVNNWHKGCCQQDVKYHFDNLGTDDKPRWIATPFIFGEENPQFKGTGLTKQKAAGAAAMKIHDSGHC